MNIDKRLRDSMRKKSIENAGFTLIEMVVVLVILGVLAVIAVPQLNNMLRDTRKAEVQLQARTLQTRNEINAIGCSTNAVECTRITSSGPTACREGMKVFLPGFWNNEFEQGDYEIKNISSEFGNRNAREEELQRMINDGEVSEASAIFTVTRDYDALLEEKGEGWFTRYNVEQPCVLYVD